MDPFLFLGVALGQGEGYLVADVWVVAFVGEEVVFYDFYVLSLFEVSDEFLAVGLCEIIGELVEVGVLEAFFSFEGVVGDGVGALFEDWIVF